MTAVDVRSAVPSASVTAFEEPLADEPERAATAALPDAWAPPAHPDRATRRERAVLGASRRNRSGRRP